MVPSLVTVASFTGVLLAIFPLLFTLKSFRALVLPDQEQFPCPSFNTMLKSNVPKNLYDNGKYQFGRYKKPIQNPNLHNITFFQNLLQKKEWHFISISTGDTLFGIAVAQLNYIATAFVYILKNDWTDQKIIMLPLGFGTKFSPSSTSGCTTWYDKISNMTIAMCNKQHETTLYVNAELSKGKTLVIDAIINTKSDSLVLAFPIGPHRVAYTHKNAAMPVTGYYKIDGINTTFGPNTLALQDWTKALHRRVTLWYWIAVNFVYKGKRIGINLSHGIYNYRKQNTTIGLENAIWVDGNVHVVETEILVTGEPGTGSFQFGRTWYCKSVDGSIDLSYEGSSATISGVSIGILDGKLIHSFGTYSGHIIIAGERYELEYEKGILEDHWTLW